MASIFVMRIVRDSQTDIVRVIGDGVRLEWGGERAGSKVLPNVCTFLLPFFIPPVIDIMFSSR